MICELDGQIIRDHVISYRDLGFGEPLENASHQYRLRLECKEVCDGIAEGYRKWVHEMKSDFELTGDASPMYLHRLGYPALDVFVNDKLALSSALKDFLYLDLFRQILPWDASSDVVRWIINDIQAIDFENDEFVVIGHAFDKCCPTGVG